MITVHHLENSRSQRILWLLEELQLPYTVQRYERDAESGLAPEALKRVHPLGKSPLIEFEGRVVAESGAIVEYLIDLADNAGLRPTDADTLQDYRYWLHYAEGSLMPLLVMSLVFSAIPKKPMPFFVRPIARALCDRVRSQFLTPNVRAHADLIEQHLAAQEWFAGASLSGADILMSFPLEAMLGRTVSVERYPAMAAYLQRLQQREAYRRALERGGPYSIPGD
jgi:glutathione S-transferase